MKSHTAIRWLGIFTTLTTLSAWADPPGVLGEPGYQGVIEPGPGPMPELVYPQPRWVVPTPFGVAPPPPLYMVLPPVVVHHWRRYCATYRACERPVYFVRPGWYRRVYLPYYRMHRDEWRGREHWEHPDEHRDEHRWDERH